MLIFLFYQLTRLELGGKFWAAFCRLWFQWQSHLQNLFRCVLWRATQCPVWDSGCGLVLSSVLRVCWLESGAHRHSSGVSPEVHKQIYGVTFLSSSSCFSCTFQLIGPSLLSPLKTRVLVPHSATCFLNCTQIWGHTAWRQREKKATRFYISLLGFQLLWSERKVSLPQFSVPEGPTMATGTSTTTAVGRPGN